MPRLPLHPSSGTGILETGSLVIRLARYGCTNRPFYHIVVMNPKIHQHAPPIEQLGSYDPLPNKYNEQLCALNIERIHYWIGRGNVTISEPVSKLFGMAGLFPIHPNSYFRAWRTRLAATTNQQVSAS